MKYQNLSCTIAFGHCTQKLDPIETLKLLYYCVALFLLRDLVPTLGCKQTRFLDSFTTFLSVWDPSPPTPDYSSSSFASVPSSNTELTTRCHPRPFFPSFDPESERALQAKEAPRDNKADFWVSIGYIFLVHWPNATVRERLCHFFH